MTTPQTQTIGPELVAWLEASALELADASPSQRERYAARLLPEHEIAFLARVELFRVFESIPRWMSIPRGEVRHSVRCRDRSRVAFETVACQGLSHPQWEASQKIARLAEGLRMHAWCCKQSVAFQTELRTHTGTCETCGLVTSRPSILVSVPWAGRVLSREYAL